MNDKALAYLLANTSSHYVNFDPSAFSGVAFIPATRPTGESIMAKPGEVFTNSACAILGFAVAKSVVALPEIAAKLRIPSDPSVDRLVSALLTSASTDIEGSRKKFAVSGLSIRIQSGQLIGSTWQLDWALRQRDRSIASPQPHSSQSRQRRMSSSSRQTRCTSAPSRGTNRRSNPLSLSSTLASRRTCSCGSVESGLSRRSGVSSAELSKGELMIDIAVLLLREPEQMLRQAGSHDK